MTPAQQSMYLSEGRPADVISFGSDVEAYKRFARDRDKRSNS